MTPRKPQLFTLGWYALPRLSEEVKEKIVPVRISVGLPRGMKGAKDLDVVHMLTPGELFSQRNQLSTAQFRARYYKRLDNYGVQKIHKVLKAISKENDGKALVLLCFEKDPAECHRSLFARWWERNTGQHVPEFDSGELPL